MRRVALVSIGLLLLIAGAPRAQSTAYRVERPVVTDGSGPRRLSVDLPLLQSAQPFARLARVQDRDSAYWRAVGGLSDLRLVDESGREIPYLLVYPRTSDPEWQNGAILPIEVVADTSSGFEVDLGNTARVDALHVEGIPPPFLKRLRLEGSGDRTRWTLLAGEATLFDLPQEALRQLSVPFAAGTYRYLRVTWNDTNSGRVPLPRASRARLAHPSVPPLELPRIEATVERRPSEPGRSRYRVRLPAGGLPVVALTLEVPGGHLYRQASVTESTLQGTAAVPREIGKAMLTRVVREGASAEDLRIPLSRPGDTLLELTVDDGSNPPLEVSRAWLELAELPWIYFEAPAGRVTARYGRPGAEEPRYDLEAARPSIRIADIRDAQWESPASAPVETGGEPAASRPQPGPPIDLTGYRYERPLSAAPGLVVASLDAAVLARSGGVDGGFADLRIVDDQARQTPYLLERLQEPLAVDLSATPAVVTARDLRSAAGRNLSVYAVRLPYANLPAGSLVLTTSARLFTRGVQVGFQRPPDRSNREAWFEQLTASRWTQKSDAAGESSVSIRIPATRDQDLVVVVDEGDNSPLPLTSVRLLLPAYRLRFYSPDGGARLVYGNERQAAPQYDFELLAARILGADVTEVQLGEERALGSGGSAGEPASLMSQRIFWMGLSLAVVVLLALVVRLLRAG